MARRGRKAASEVAVPDPDLTRASQDCILDLAGDIAADRTAARLHGNPQTAAPPARGPARRLVARYDWLPPGGVPKPNWITPEKGSAASTGMKSRISSEAFQRYRFTSTVLLGSSALENRSKMVERLGSCNAPASISCARVSSSISFWKKPPPPPPPPNNPPPPHPAKAAVAAIIPVIFASRTIICRSPHRRFFWRFWYRTPLDAARPFAVWTSVGGGVTTLWHVCTMVVARRRRRGWLACIRTAKARWKSILISDSPS